MRHLVLIMLLLPVTGCNLLKKGLGTSRDAVPPFTHIFIMYGESGMVGKQQMGSMPFDAFMLGFDGKWKPAYEPTHDSIGCIYEPYKDQTAGISPGKAFTETLTSKGIKVGLVPCARNGRNIQELSYGGAYFTSCMDRINEAKKHGQITGILISQGINDAIQEVPAQQWSQDFQRMVQDLRTQAGAPSVPIIIMKLFSSPLLANYRSEQRQMEIPGLIIINADDLPRLDSNHLNMWGTEELGRRYAQAWLKTINY